VQLALFLPARWIATGCSRISEIKERAGTSRSFDHKFLNKTTPPSVQLAWWNIARHYGHLAPLFLCRANRLSVGESLSSATLFRRFAANYWFDFSAARRTVSPPMRRKCLFGGNFIHGLFIASCVSTAQLDKRLWFGAMINALSPIHYVGLDLAISIRVAG
jgi:hypothetical protein